MRVVVQALVDDDGLARLVTFLKTHSYHGLIDHCGKCHPR